MSGTVTYIQFPVHPDKGILLCSRCPIRLNHHTGYAFRSDARYFVLAERHRSKDTLGIYDASDSFKLVRVRFHASSVFKAAVTKKTSTAFPASHNQSLFPRSITHGKPYCGMGERFGGALLDPRALVQAPKLSSSIK